MSAETKTVTFGKEGTRQVPVNKALKWYPTEDTPVPKKVSLIAGN